MRQPKSVQMIKHLKGKDTSYGVGIVFSIPFPPDIEAELKLLKLGKDRKILRVIDWVSTIDLESVDIPMPKTINLSKDYSEESEE